MITVAPVNPTAACTSCATELPTTPPGEPGSGKPKRVKAKRLETDCAE